MTEDRGGTTGFGGASAGEETVTARSKEGDGLGGTVTGALGLAAAGGAGRLSEGERRRRRSTSESSDVGASGGRSRMIGKAGVELKFSLLFLWTGCRFIVSGMAQFRGFGRSA